MTYQELYEIVKRNVRAKVVDYRPAVDLYFSKHMEVGIDRTEGIPGIHIWFPNSIIMELGNGDQLIYIKKDAKKE